MQNKASLSLVVKDMGSSLSQLYYPQGVVVDQLGTVYVADEWNHRIMRWPKGNIHRSV